MTIRFYVALHVGSDQVSKAPWFGLSVGLYLLAQLSWGCGQSPLPTPKAQQKQHFQLLRPPDLWRELTSGLAVVKGQRCGGLLCKTTFGCQIALPLSEPCVFRLIPTSEKRSLWIWKVWKVSISWHDGPVSPRPSYRALYQCSVLVYIGGAIEQNVRVLTSGKNWDMGIKGSTWAI